MNKKYMKTRVSVAYRKDTNCTHARRSPSATAFTLSHSARTVTEPVGASQARHALALAILLDIGRFPFSFSTTPHRPSIFTPHLPRLVIITSHTSPFPHTPSPAERMSPPPSKISVLLPTFNERENLPYIVYLLHETFASLASLASLELIIIDDHSPDGTGAVALALLALYPSTIVLAPRSARLGLGSAYRHGAARATGDYILLMDADLSHHPKFIPALLAAQAASGADVVSGTRYVGGGGVCGWDVSRKLVSRGANFLAGAVLRPGVTDLTGSFRLYRRAAFDRIMREVVSNGYVFQMEIIVRARKIGMRIEEVPITFVDRLFGESKLGSVEVVRYLQGIWLLLTTKGRMVGGGAWVPKGTAAGEEKEGNGTAVVG